MAAAITAMLVLLQAGDLYLDDEPVTLRMLLFELLKVVFLVGCTVIITLLILGVRVKERKPE